MNYYLKVIQNYAVFSGRARRKEYWMFYLINLIVVIGLSLVSESIGNPMIVNLYNFGVLIPSIAVGVRRMHDTGRSGWYILIPIYNLILAATEGEKGENKYGPDPKAEEIVTI